MIGARLLSCMGASALLAGGAFGQEPAAKEATAGQVLAAPEFALNLDRLPREAAGPAIDKAAAFLVKQIREDGSWGDDAPTLAELGFAVNTFRSWRIASHGIVCMALASLDETPERRAALERAVGWLCDAHLPKRDSDWDIDYVWSSLYGFTSVVELLRIAALPKVRCVDAC